MPASVFGSTSYMGQCKSGNLYYVYLTANQINVNYLYRPTTKQFLHTLGISWTDTLMQKANSPLKGFTK
jgi:hypothetical protein